MQLPDCEKLMHLISVQGELGLTRFLDYFEQLYPANFGLDEDERYYARFQTIRFLEALGHCEYDYSNRRIYACKPVITLQSNWGLPQAILSGARTPALIRSLREFAGKNKDKIVLREISQPYYPVLPHAVILKAVSLDALREVALDLGIGCDAGQETSSIILDFSLSVQQMYEELEFNISAELNWRKLMFSTESLSFSMPVPSSNNLVLAEYTNRITRQKIHFLWSEGKAAVIERDWGRFIVLFLEGKSVLLYNKKKFQLLVPKNIPLPALIARAVTLKSGIVPVVKTVAAKKYWVYGSIDPVFAGQIGEKLGQSPEEI
jgi:hypothetical protein